MENDNLEDLYNEMLEAQEADMEARGMMDAPDSFQIALALLIILWGTIWAMCNLMRD